MLVCATYFYFFGLNENEFVGVKTRTTFKI